jgi:hypothetical protein
MYGLIWDALVPKLVPETEIGRLPLDKYTGFTELIVGAVFKFN